MLTPAREILSQKNFGKNCLKEVQDAIIHIVLEHDDHNNDIDYSSYASMVSTFTRSVLKECRNQKVVTSRLSFSDKIPTLEELARRFDLSRERIRQIIKKEIALLRKTHNRLNPFWKTIEQITTQGGGIITLEELSRSLQENYDWPVAPNPSALARLLTIWQPGTTFASATDLLTVECACLACERPLNLLFSLDFDTQDSYNFQVVGHKILEHCRTHCNEHSGKKFNKAFIKRVVAASNRKYVFDGDLVFLYDRWLLCHSPRLEDVAVRVLATHGRPMHFREIAAVIRKENIRHQNISDHSVHSALLRFNTVELVNRGRYALKEWGMRGYRSVSKAIEELLEEHGLPLRRRTIIAKLAGEFSEQNISTALTSWKDRFVNIGEGFYDRTERWRQRTSRELLALLPQPLAKFADFVISRNNTSYKPVMALLFIRSMDANGTLSLYQLKEMFYNFYRSRHKKGLLVETPAAIVSRIGILDPAEIKRKAPVEPIRRFIASNFFYKYGSTLGVALGIAEHLTDSKNLRDTMMICLLKAIDEYYQSITPSSYALKSSQNEKFEVMEPLPETTNAAAEDTAPGGDAPSIAIRKRGRRRIRL